MTSRARRPASKKAIPKVKKPVIPQTVVFSSDESDIDVKPVTKKTAVVKQGPEKDSSKTNQDPTVKKLRRVRHSLLHTARRLPQPFLGSKLLKEYGKPVPLEKYGFSTLVEFLSQHPHLVPTKGRKVRYFIRSPEVQHGKTDEVDARARQLVLSAARTLVSPFSFSDILKVLRSSGERTQLSKIKLKTLPALIPTIPEIEVVDKEKFKLRGWEGPDKRALRNVPEYECLQEYVYQLALGLKSPFSSSKLAQAHGNSRIPFEKYGSITLSDFLKEHPRFGKLDKRREKCFYLKEPAETVPKENVRKRALKDGSNKERSSEDDVMAAKMVPTPVGVKKSGFIEFPQRKDAIFFIPSEESSLLGSASNLTPQVGWNDNLVPAQGRFFTPAPQFNPMSFPPQMMPYQMQPMPMGPSKNELFGQMITQYLDEADREGKDSSDLSQRLMKTIAKFKKKK